MSDRPFTPVWLNLLEGPRQVRSAYEALECLETAWPIVSGIAHRRAIQHAHDALEGFVPAATARDALKRAAAEAGVATFNRMSKRLAGETPQTGPLAVKRISAPDDCV